MTLFKNTLAGMFIIGFLVALAYGLYYTFHLVIGAFSSLEAVQKTVLFTGALTMLLSAVVIAVSLRGLGKRLQNHRLQDEKLAAYGNLINAWRALVHGPRHSIQPEEEQILLDIESHLALAASPRVLRAYDRMQQMRYESGLQHPDLVAQLQKVILEIRKDVGLSDWTHAGDDGMAFLASTDEPQQKSQ